MAIHNGNSSADQSAVKRAISDLSGGVGNNAPVSPSGDNLASAFGSISLPKSYAQPTKTNFDGFSLLATGVVTAFEGTYNYPKKVMPWLKDHANQWGLMLAQFYEFIYEWPDYEAPLALLRSVSTKFDFSEHAIQLPYGEEAPYESLMQELYAQAALEGSTWDYYGPSPQITAWIEKFTAAFCDRFSTQLLQLSPKGSDRAALLLISVAVVDLSGFLCKKIYGQSAFNKSGPIIDSAVTRATRPIASSLLFHIIERLDLDIGSFSDCMSAFKACKIVENRCAGSELGEIFRLGVGSARIGIDQILPVLQELDSRMMSNQALSGLQKYVECIPSSSSLTIDLSLGMIGPRCPIVVHDNSNGMKGISAWLLLQMDRRRALFGYQQPESCSINAVIGGVEILASRCISIAQTVEPHAGWQCRWAPVPQFSETERSTLNKALSRLYPPIQTAWEAFSEAFAELKPDDLVIITRSAKGMNVTLPARLAVTDHWLESHTSVVRLDPVVVQQVFEEAGITMERQAAGTVSYQIAEIGSDLESDPPSEVASTRVQPLTQIRRHFQSVGFPSYQEVQQHLIRVFNVQELSGKGSHRALIRVSSDGRKRYTTCTSTRAETERVRIPILADMLSSLGISVEEYLASIS